MKTADLLARIAYLEESIADMKAMADAALDYQFRETVNETLRDIATYHIKARDISDPPLIESSCAESVKMLEELEDGK